MTVWVLSIVGIVILSVMVDIIIPEGESNKYVKSIMALVTVFIIFQPLPSLLNSDIDFTQAYSDQSYTQTDLSESIYALRLEYCYEKVEKVLKDLKVEGAQIAISARNEDSFAVIEKVSINLTKTVIDKGNQHIFITGKIIQNVSAALSVEEGLIEVYG